MPECSFLLLTSPRDIEFLSHTLDHLLKMCSFHFHEVIIVADDLPKEQSAKDHLSQCRKLFSILEDWQRKAKITRYICLSAISMGDLAEKYFGCQLSETRDSRGVPLFGWIAGLEAAQSNFVVHFDSDILLYQAPDHNWIDEGIALINEDPTTMFVSPLPGPPANDGLLHGQAMAPTLDDRGNFRFKTFSSRRFLVNKSRFEELLPTPPRYVLPEIQGFMGLGPGKSTLDNWEYSVSCILQESEYFRVHLRSHNAWSVHCLDHSRDWLDALPLLIGRVEKGQYPAEQGGHYDLLLSAWSPLFGVGD